MAPLTSGLSRSALSRGPGRVIHRQGNVLINPTLIPRGKERPARIVGVCIVLGKQVGPGGAAVEAHVDLPADRRPVAAGCAELCWLWVLVAIGARDAERSDTRVAEGKDEVARRDLAHGLVEGIAGFLSVELGRPEIAAGDFVAV